MILTKQSKTKQNKTKQNKQKQKQNKNKKIVCHCLVSSYWFFCGRFGTSCYVIINNCIAWNIDNLKQATEKLLRIWNRAEYHWLVQGVKFALVSFHYSTCKFGTRFRCKEWFVNYNACHVAGEVPLCRLYKMQYNYCLGGTLSQTKVERVRYLKI